MKTVAIIGSMFGDEGKGLMTDYMCSQMMKGSTKGAVVRFQGGAQSGHTVVTPDGKRHVFSHIGSGTLLGLPTILSYKFVCNPILFLKEYNEIKGFNPKVYVSPECYITTPYDVAFNRELERSRGKERHGSVGIGFGETIEREEVANITLWYEDLYKSNDYIASQLMLIKLYYKEKCKNLDIDPINVLYGRKADYLMIDDFKTFKAYTSPFDSLGKQDFLIFESGQGLGLDMEYGTFPHVTRSRTGILHAQEFCDEHNINLDEVIYLTRSYTTRHGAGPLRNETDRGFNHIVDKTNKKNEFQGNLRFSPLDFDKFIELTGKDSNNFKGSVKFMMTWLDAVKDYHQICLADMLWDNSRQEFMEFVTGNFDYGSFGPTRKDVVENNVTYENLKP